MLLSAATVPGLRPEGLGDSDDSESKTNHDGTKVLPSHVHRFTTLIAQSLHSQWNRFQETLSLMRDLLKSFSNIEILMMLTLEY